jgi:membrane associated rhomboid family serine protease
MSMPANTLLLAINLYAAFSLWSRRVDPSDVAVSYDAVVLDCEYWRFATASFSHFEIMHLGFNMMSLYQMVSYSLCMLLQSAFAIVCLFVK